MTTRVSGGKPSSMRRGLGAFVAVDLLALDMIEVLQNVPTMRAVKRDVPTLPRRESPVPGRAADGSGPGRRNADAIYRNGAAR
jgi:hypothetical protein